MAGFIERHAARILSWALHRRLGIARFLIDREIDAIAHTVVGGAEWFHDETDILAARLTRRYDVGMAMNESTNRAIKAKAEMDLDPDPIRELTDKQKLALAFQEQYLKRIGAPVTR